MQPAHAMKRLPALECLDEIEQLVRRSLRGNWVIRIEYADTGSHANWQTWGKPLFAVRDSATITDAILACRAGFPARAIRLNAQRFHPDTRLLYWVQRPQQNQADSVSVAPTTLDTGTGALRAPSLGGRGIWGLMALAAMLLASALMFEGSLFA